jgi:transcriptional regulator with XRE-family HTH domain
MTDRTDQLRTFGAFVRAQRQLANLSLRQMSELAEVSNPYLSQLERGLHEPSMRVLQSIARALDLSTEMLLAQVGADDEPGEDEHAGDPSGGVERAIRKDPRLTTEQKQALLSVYESYVRDA